MNTTVDSKYPKMSPQELAQDLGVSLTQKLQPNLRDTVPSRFVTIEEATARGMSMYRDGKTGACRYGHDNTARYTSNPNRCSDCVRVKEGLGEPIYGKSRTNKHYPEPRRKPVDGSAPVAAATAPAAPPAQVEPTKREQGLIAAIAEHGDLDKACAAVGWTRPLMEARYSVNEVFRKAVDATLERLQIPRTLRAAEDFPWTDAVKRNLVNQYIDSGLLLTAREAVGVSASQYYARIESDPAFATAIENARPLAAATLTARATQAAALGRIDLLKYLEASAPKDDLSGMSHDQVNAEILKLLKGFDKMNLLTATDANNADLVS